MPGTIRFKEHNQDGQFIWQHVEATGVDLFRGAPHARFRRGSWTPFTQTPLVLSHNPLITDVTLTVSDEELSSIVAGSIPRRIIRTVNNLTKATPKERLYGQGSYAPKE